MFRRRVSQDASNTQLAVPHSLIIHTQANRLAQPALLPSLFFSSHTLAGHHPGPTHYNTMPPKSSSIPSAPRGRPAGSKNKTTASSTTASKKSSAVAKGKEPVQLSNAPEPRSRDDNDDDDNSDEPMEEAGDDDDDGEPEKTIPPELLTRILHEFFEKDGTRITKDANNSVAKYMDIFVKEAIARAAAERSGGFLEVSTAS